MSLRVGIGSITITDVKGWDGTNPTYSSLEGSIEDVPGIKEITSGKIKKEDTYTKEEIEEIMDSMVRFDNQTYFLVQPDNNNKIILDIKTDGIDDVNMVIKWSKTEYEYCTYSLGDDSITTEREYPDDSLIILRFTGNVGFSMTSGKIVDVIQWGTTMTKFVYMEGLLKGYEDEGITAQDLCSTSAGISLRSLLEDAQNFNQYINRWFPRYPGNLSRCFYNCYSFNQSINNINTLYVTNIDEIFYNCSVFNQPLYRWELDNVYSARASFQNCENFNQDVSMWSTGQIVDMSNMFNNVAISDVDFSNWDVTNVTSSDNFLISSGDNNILPNFE